MPYGCIVPLLMRHLDCHRRVEETSQVDFALCVGGAALAPGQPLGASGGDSREVAHALKGEEVAQRLRKRASFTAPRGRLLLYPRRNGEELF